MEYRPGEQHARNIQTILFFKDFTVNTCTNSGAPDQLQFHRFISECFGSRLRLKCFRLL